MADKHEMSGKELEQAAKSPDYFLLYAEKVLSFLSSNGKFILAATVVILFAGIGWSAYSWWMERTEKQAQEKLYGAEKEFLKIKEKFDEAKYRKLAPEAAAKDKQEPAIEASGDLQKDYGAVLPALEAVVQAHPKTRAAAQAALDLASTYLNYNQPDKALELISKAASGLKSNELLFGLTHILWGDALVAKDDCATAITRWQRVLQSPAQDFVHGDAYVKSGICYEKLNQTDKAMEMYRKASADTDSRVAQTAKSLLRYLELKQNRGPG